jgi:hypothetical protein
MELWGKHPLIAKHNEACSINIILSAGKFAFGRRFNIQREAALSLLLPKHWEMQINLNFIYRVN